MASEFIDIPAKASPRWKSPVANVAALPSTGNTQGDARVTNNDQSIYIWSGSAWVQVSGGGGGTPGGSNTELQYNNSGSFGGISGTTWDGVDLFLNNIKWLNAATNDNVLYIQGSNVALSDSVSPDAKVLRDGSGYEAISWSARNLHQSDGTTVVLDWSTGAAFFPGQTPTLTITADITMSFGDVGENVIPFSIYSAAGGYAAFRPDTIGTLNGAHHAVWEIASGGEINLGSYNGIGSGISAAVGSVSIFTQDGGAGGSPAITFTAGASKQVNAFAALYSESMFVSSDGTSGGTISFSVATNGDITTDGTPAVTEDVEVALSGGGSTVLHFVNGLYTGRD